MPKRKEYERRFHTPLFPTEQKTTTPEGKNEYMKQYMRKVRELQKQKR